MACRVGLSAALIEEASEVLRNVVLETPVEESPGLSALLGVPVFLKLECLQRTGSFKLRGAFFRLARLDQEETKAGVVTCSVGNHGRALAWAASRLGIESTVYAPSNLEPSRRQAMESLGARVVCSPYPGYDDTLEWMRDEERDRGRTFVSAYDEAEIMAGNGGSLAIEILNQLPTVRTFVFPVGGGGMAAGLSFWVKDRFPDAHLIACQHASSPALALSLEKGEAVVRLPSIETSAVGIEGGIGAACFEVIRGRLDQVALLTESEILDAVDWVITNHQYLIEPSSAVAIAALLKGEVEVPAGAVAVILSGRNVDRETLRRVLVA